MPINFQENKYPGINPHLNSFLQQPDGGWESFHGEHNTVTRIALDEALPDGYYAALEKSLQIQADPDDYSGKIRRTVPDVAVYTRGDTSGQTATQTQTPVLNLPIVETYPDEIDMSAVVIHELIEGKAPGKPVTRIELLSPGNKPGGSHHVQYLSKRQETLESGLSLVEMDYLHESNPVLSQLPNYRKNQENSYPYYILISTPEDGRTRVYGTRIMETLPKLAIPLKPGESVLLDFNEVYNRTFSGGRLFPMLADYSQPPINFDKYHEADQQTIQKQLALIQREKESQ